MSNNLFGEEATQVPPKKYNGKFRLQLRNNYEFDEVASALQKCIRRSQEREAVYWAAIIYKSGFSKYLKKRLSVIIHEDIGVTSPLLLLYANQLKIDSEGKKRVSELEKAETREDDFLPIANLIILACRSRKTRMADEITNLVFEEIEGEFDYVPIPEFAIDPHVSVGKERYGGWEQGSSEDKMRRVRMWFDHWSKLDNEAEEFNTYREELKEMWGYYGSCWKWKKELTPKEIKAIEEEVQGWLKQKK